MIDLRESKDYLIIIRESRNKLLQHMFGLSSFLALGLVLINPSTKLSLTYSDLMSGWFTAILGTIFCLLMLFTHEHTSKWIFDRTSSSLTVEHKTINGCRHFEFPLEQIKSIRVIYLSDERTEIFIPDLKPTQ